MHGFKSSYTFDPFVNDDDGKECGPPDGYGLDILDFIDSTDHEQSWLLRTQSLKSARTEHNRARLLSNRHRSTSPRDTEDPPGTQHTGKKHRKKTSEPSPRKTQIQPIQKVLQQQTVDQTSKSKSSSTPSSPMIAIQLASDGERTGRVRAGATSTPRKKVHSRSESGGDPARISSPRNIDSGDTANSDDSSNSASMDKKRRSSRSRSRSRDRKNTMRSLLGRTLEMEINARSDSEDSSLGAKQDNSLKQSNDQDGYGAMDLIENGYGAADLILNSEEFDTKKVQKLDSGGAGFSSSGSDLIGGYGKFDIGGYGPGPNYVDSGSKSTSTDEENGYGASPYTAMPSDSKSSSEETPTGYGPDPKLKDEKENGYCNAPISTSSSESNVATSPTGYGASYAASSSSTEDSSDNRVPEDQLKHSRPSKPRPQLLKRPQIRRFPSSVTLEMRQQEEKQQREKQKTKKHTKVLTISSPSSSPTPTTAKDKPQPMTLQQPLMKLGGAQRVQKVSTEPAKDKDWNSEFMVRFMKSTIN